MNSRLIELAIKGLEAELASIDREIADLRQQVNGGNRTVRPSESTTPKGRRRLTAAGRKKLSEMMKARWAARRKAAAKN